jgi:hypothetical protein
MSDICGQWQRQGDVTLDWFFQQARLFGEKKVVFNSVALDSPLFNKLREKTQEFALTPEYVITEDQFCQAESLVENLQMGVHYTLLVYSPLSTQTVTRMTHLQKYLEQMKFVILARKDWNVRNCFRSVPHFMRQRLCVDFPTSLHDSDPFFAPAELAAVRAQLSQDFLDQEVSEFCPDLGVYNEWGRKNVSHFSQPRKFLRHKPKVSIITTDPQKLATLVSCDALLKEPEAFEILLSGVAGHKVQASTKIPGVVMTRYSAYPIEPNQPISEKTLLNYLASQSDGEMLVFLDPVPIRNVDALFSRLLESTENPSVFFVRQGHYAFARATFCATGGFDELLSGWDAERLRLRQFMDAHGYSKDGIFSLEASLAAINEPGDQLLLTGRLASVIEDFTFLSGDSSSESAAGRNPMASEERRYRREEFKEKYRTLLHSTPRAAVEGHLKLLLTPLLILYEKMIHYTRLHGWRVSRRQMEHYIRPFFWRLNPWSYSWMWRLQGAPQRVYGYAVRGYWQIRRVQGRAYAGLIRFYWQIRRVQGLAYAGLTRFYWDSRCALDHAYAGVMRFYWQRVFRWTYPMRKVYYFLHFQYEKRILKLHRKPIQEES